MDYFWDGVVCGLERIAQALCIILCIVFVVAIPICAAQLPGFLWPGLTLAWRVLIGFGIVVVLIVIGCGILSVITKGESNGG